LPAGTVGICSLTFPVIAISAGVLFGGEHVGARELAGSALVLCGMAVALVPARNRRALHTHRGAASGDVADPVVLRTHEVA
jgi:drug/metabolite transporter (DMT)-like permease